MTELNLKLLGELAVIRDGVSLLLPPSKKTRALLAYLVMNQRSLRREKLCSLLWEIPDDPRGALRWSLSKLRNLVDTPGHERIVADRTHIAFALQGACVDALSLHDFLKQDLDALSTEQLENAVHRYQGHFLEGLELSNFHEFHAWCVAERESVTRAQAQLLNAMINRLQPTPEPALDYARKLAQLTPYNEQACATVIRLLATLGRHKEAEQNYLLGTRLLAEAGLQPSDLLRNALKSKPSPLPVAPTDLPPDPSPTLPPTPFPAQSPAPTIVNASAGQTAEPLKLRTRFTGREQELQQLLCALPTGNHLPEARVLLLTGVPGIGKSSLLDAFASHIPLAEYFLLRAGNYDFAVARPFGMWMDAFRSATAPGSETVQKMLASLLAAPQQQSPPSPSLQPFNRDLLFGTISDVIASQSVKQPVIIIFEDIQWGDESSVSLIHYVALMNRHRNLLIVLSAREGELRDNRAAMKMTQRLWQDGLLTALPLGPLPAAELQQLILQHDPQADSRRIAVESEGNPLFAIELTRAQSTTHAGINSLQEIVRDRLAQLDEDAVEMLRWAAAMGEEVQADSLQALTGLPADSIEHGLQRAAQYALLKPVRHACQFAHNLVRKAIYEELSSARRCVMHQRIAQLYERKVADDLSLAAQLAHHASLAEEPAIAARAMVSCGRLCLRYYANTQAQSLARQGLEFAQQLNERDKLCLTLELMDICLAAQPPEDWEGLAKNLVSLAEQAMDAGAPGHARLGYHLVAYLRWEHGQWQGARDGMLEAERISRSSSNDVQAIGMAEAAKCLAMLERDLPRAEAMLLEARALAQRDHTDIPAIPAAQGLLRYHQSRFAEAAELFQEARTLTKIAGDHVNEFQANEYLLMIDFEQGRYAQALERSEVLPDLADKVRDGSEAPFARALSLLCQYALQQTDSETLDAALEALRQADAKHRLAYTLTRAATIDIQRHRLTSATQRAEEALVYANILQRPTEIALARVTLAECHKLRGEWNAFKQEVAILTRLCESGMATWARTRVQALLKKGVESDGNDNPGTTI